MFSRLLGYVVTFVLLFVLFDGVLRLAGCGPKPTLNRFDAATGWAKRPGEVTERSTSEFDVTFAVNSKGLRGPEVDYAKPAGTKRVLVVGDSFTLGYTVDERDLFLRLVEKDLRTNGHSVEVLNAGTEGWSTDQELVWFEQEGRKYQPDVVVLAPYLNDVFWNTQDNYTGTPKPQFALQGGALERVNPTLVEPPEKSWFARNVAIGHVLDLMQKARLLPTTQVGGRTVMLEYAPLLAVAPFEIDEAWKVTGALMRRFADAVRANGAQPVALVIPNKWEVDPAYALPRELGGVPRSELDVAAPTRRFVELAQAAGFALVDPTEALRAKAAEGTPVYFTKDWHWNATGNHVVAGALLDRLEQPDLLGPGSGLVSGATESAYVGEVSAAAAVPTWVWIVGALWLFLGTLFWRTQSRESPLLAYVKVGALIGFVVAVFFGVGALAARLPPSAARWVMPAIVIGLLGFIIVKAGRRFATIAELYGTFLRRGHWYMLPMLVVMLSIGMLLVVAASSPFVAPFIYTLF